MHTLLKDEVRTARKEYRCDAFSWWRNTGLALVDCDTDEQREVIAAAEEAKGMIRPGEKYRYQRGVFEQHMVTWRERLEMGNVCRDLGLYDNCD